MTNAEWIKSLNDEQLAQVLSARRCFMCIYSEQKSCGTVSCDYGISTWLQKTHEPVLKGCPFCGSSDVGHDTLKVNSSCRVKCNNCGVSTKYYDTIEEASSAWNTRIY